MMRSIAEDELTVWLVGALRVYAYLDDTFITEYVLFTKKSNDIFECDRDLSTIYLGHQNRADMVKLLMSDRLKYREHGMAWMDYRKYKTGGCECGGWATSNPNCHAFDCPKYLK